MIKMSELPWRNHKQRATKKERQKRAISQVSRGFLARVISRSNSRYLPNHQDNEEKSLKLVAV